MTYNTSSTSGLCLTEGMLFALKYKRQTNSRHCSLHRSQSLIQPLAEDYTPVNIDNTLSQELPASLSADPIPNEDNLYLSLDRGNHSIYSKYCDSPISLASRLKRWKKYNISPDRYCNDVSIKSNSFGILADYCGDDIYIAERPDRTCTNFCAYDDFGASLKYLNNFHSRMFHSCSRRRLNLLKNIGCYPCNSTCPTYSNRTCGPLYCLSPPRLNPGTGFKFVPLPPLVKPVSLLESLEPNISPPPQVRPPQPRSSFKLSANDIVLPPPEVHSVSFRSPVQSRSEADIPTPSQEVAVSPGSAFMPRDSVTILSPHHVRPAINSVNTLSPPLPRQSSRVASIQTDGIATYSINPGYYMQLSSLARRQLFNQSISIASKREIHSMHDIVEIDKSTSTVEENFPIMVENHKNGTKIIVETRDTSTITTPEKEQRSSQTWEERHKKSTQTSQERNELLKKLPYVSSRYNLLIRQRELFDKWSSMTIPGRRIKSSHSDITIQRKGANPSHSHTVSRQANGNNVQTPHLKKVSFEDKFVNTELVPQKTESINKATSPKPMTHDKATSVELKMLDKSTLTDVQMADTASNTDAPPSESELKKRSATNDLNYYELVTPSACCPSKCRWDRYADDIFSCKTDCKVNSSCILPSYLVDPCANRCTLPCTAICSDAPSCLQPRSRFESQPSLRHCEKSTSSCQNFYLKC